MGRSLVAQLLKICQTHGNVEIHAMEANPNVASRLAKTYSINGIKGAIHSKAAWSTTGETFTFVEPLGEPKNGYLVPGGTARKYPNRKQIGRCNISLSAI